MGVNLFSRTRVNSRQKNTGWLQIRQVFRRPSFLQQAIFCGLLHWVPAIPNLYAFGAIRSLQDYKLANKEKLFKLVYIINQKTPCEIIQECAWSSVFLPCRLANKLWFSRKLFIFEMTPQNCGTWSEQQYWIWMKHMGHPKQNCSWQYFRQKSFV